LGFLLPLFFFFFSSSLSKKIVGASDPTLWPLASFSSHLSPKKLSALAIQPSGHSRPLFSL
jgi:hypothetical protein